MNLKDRIAAARASVPAGQNQPKAPENAYKISGLFVKEDKENSSWVAAVTGVEADGHLKLEFPEIFSEIEWQNKKGDTPRGMKTYHLTDGVYKARIVAKRDQDATWHVFAVVDGQREDLTEQVAAALFNNESVDFPDEDSIPESAHRPVATPKSIKKSS